MLSLSFQYCIFLLSSFSQSLFFSIKVLYKFKSAAELIFEVKDLLDRLAVFAFCILDHSQTA